MPLQSIHQKSILFFLSFQSISNNGCQQETTKDLSTCIQLISTLLTNVTALIKRQMESVHFPCLGDFPIFCVRILKRIYDNIASSTDTEIQTLSTQTRSAQNLLLILLTSDKLTIDSRVEHLVYMEQSMFVHHLSSSNIY